MFDFFCAQVIAVVVNGMVDDFTCVSGVVHIDVVRGGIPRFVGVKGVDVQEEFFVGVVCFQPVCGALHGAGDKGVAFCFPVCCAPAIVILLHALRRANFFGD